MKKYRRSFILNLLSYTKRTMTFELKHISIGKGKPEWGAPTEDVFIIKLRNRV